MMASANGTVVLFFWRGGMQSGQVHIISSEHDDSDDEFVAAATPPRIDPDPNTKNLDESEFSLATMQSCGLLQRSARKRPKSVTSMIGARERGMFGSESFTRGDCCKVANTFLPNRMKTVATYQSKAFCGTFSQDGSVFLTACQDRNLRLYNTHEGNFKYLRSIQARDVGWSILDTAFSPDNNFIVYSSWSECLHLCRLHGDIDHQDALPLGPQERRFCIFSVTFSTDGREILGGGNDGFLYVYDRECNQRALRIEGHENDVNTVAFADDTSHILYSGGDDGLCKVWDRRTLSEQNPVPVGVLAGHMDGVTYIDPRGDGRHFISNSKDQSIKLWDVRVFSSKDGQENTLKAVADQSWDYRWQKVPKKLLNPKKPLDGDTSIMTYRGHTVLQTLVRCHFSPPLTTGQRYIYTGCAAGRVIIYDTLTGRIEKKLTGHRGCVRDVSWHPYRPEIMSTSWDASVGQWTYNPDCDSEMDGNAADGNAADTVDEELKEAERNGRILRRSRRIALQRARQVLENASNSGS